MEYQKGALTATYAAAAIEVQQGREIPIKAVRGGNFGFSVDCAGVEDIPSRGRGCLCSMVCQFFFFEVKESGYERDKRVDGVGNGGDSSADGV